jgi:hypothetical protein
VEHTVRFIDLEAFNAPLGVAVLELVSLGRRGIPKAAVVNG